MYKLTLITCLFISFALYAGTSHTVTIEIKKSAIEKVEKIDTNNSLITVVNQ